MGWMTTPADRDAAYAIVTQLKRCADSLDTIAIALVKLSLDQPRVVDSDTIEKLRDQLVDRTTEGM